MRRGRGSGSDSWKSSPLMRQIPVDRLKSSSAWRILALWGVGDEKLAGVGDQESYVEDGVERQDAEQQGDGFGDLQKHGCGLL